MKVSSTTAALAISLRSNASGMSRAEQKYRMTHNQLRAELTMTRLQPEAALHKAVIEYLRLILPKGTVIHHSPNEGKRGLLEQRALKNNGTMAGWPDIEIVWNGWVFFIELKSAKGRLRPEQIACHDALTFAGARVATCRYINEVQQAIAAWGIPTRDKTKALAA